MDITSYCDTRGRQLTEWKAKIDDVIRGAEKMPMDQRTPFADSLSQLNSFMDELDNSLTRLAAECPIEWSAQRDSIDDKLVKMQHTLAQLSIKVGLPDSIAWL